MTACTALRLQLGAYVDDELGVDAAIEIERHLAQCRACRREMVRQRQLQRALRALHPIAAPPAGLEERARAAVVGPAPQTPRAPLAVAALVALVVAGGAAWWATTRAPDRSHGDATADATTLAVPSDAVVAAADTHRRLGDAAAALELTSSDVEEINGWFARRLPFAADVTAPAAPGVTVTGAAVVRLAERPAGLVRYRVVGHDVSLFLLPRPVWDAAEPSIRVRNVEFRVFRRNGLELVGWSHAPLSYLLVSDRATGTGAACATCHAGDDRAAIAEFVTAVAGGVAGT